jgi:hypothetical protein
VPAAQEAELLKPASGLVRKTPPTSKQTLAEITQRTKKYEKTTDRRSSESDDESNRSSNYKRITTSNLKGGEKQYGRPNARRFGQSCKSVESQQR